MSEDVWEPLKEVLYSGYIGEGQKTVDFEKTVEDRFGIRNVLSLNNGTAGLHLAYQMIIDYDPNAEIIASPMTCSATLTPIVANKAKIVWADIDPSTGNIDPYDIEKRITSNTKAIVAVHWGGNPCNMNAINQVAQKYGLKVVEDGAHSLGAKYNGTYVGGISDFTMFSLQAIKHVTSIDGGLLVCKNDKDYARAKLLRWYGIDRSENREVKDLRCELDISEAGHKMHMNDVNAVIGLYNFKHLDEILKKHRENAAYYDNVFLNTPIVPTKVNPADEAAYWLYTINVNNRDELMEELRNNGVMSSKVHARNDTHSMFKGSLTSLPGVDEFDSKHLCIPVGWWVEKKDREKIAQLVLKFAR